MLVLLLCLTDLSNGTIALWSCLGWVFIPLTCALPCVACYDCVGDWTAPKKASTTNKVDPRPVDHEDTKDTTSEIDEDDSDTEDSSADTSTITC